MGLINDKRPRSWSPAGRPTWSSPRQKGRWL